jgi:hypothetical protein
MADLRDKIPYALDEARTLVLGIEVLVGFQYHSFFEQLLLSQPVSARYPQGGALILTLVALSIILAPPAYHRIVDKGCDNYAMKRYTGRMLTLGLAPFSLALGLSGDLHVVIEKITGRPLTALMVSGAMLLLFVTLWFLYPLYRRSSRDRAAGVPHTLSTNR